MSHVFISYAREDYDTARALATALDQSRIPVWWDPKIRLGKKFPPAIRQALQESYAVVVLWSRASIGSSWVIKEAGIGARQGALLPVLLEYVDPPGEFAELNCADLSNWDPQRPHRGFDQIRRILLTGAAEGSGQAVQGDWSAELLDRETLFVRLDNEQHTVRYSRGHLYVDDELTVQGTAQVVDKRTFRFELSDGPERYFAQLDVWVSAFRGSVKRMTLSVGGTVLHEG